MVGAAEDAIIPHDFRALPLRVFRDPRPHRAAAKDAVSECTGLDDAEGCGLCQVTRLP